MKMTADLTYHELIEHTGLVELRDVLSIVEAGDLDFAIACAKQHAEDDGRDVAQAVADVRAAFAAFNR